MSQARPFLKWVGGKTQLYDRIAALLPPSINTYYEPFVGGGAVFWGLAAEGRFAKAILSDANAELMTAYAVVRDLPEALIEFLEAVKGDYDADPRGTFDHWRDGVGAKPTNALDAGGVAQAGRMLFLNKTCFNGLYRVNKKGRFNTPFGAYKNPRICDAENIRACSLAMGDRTTLLARDFGHTVVGVLAPVPGDAVYFDPPYIPMTKTSSFTKYQAGGFGEVEHGCLAEVFRGLADHGVAVVLSNSDTPLARDLYAGFEMHVVPARRAINSKGDQRGPVNELIVVGRRVG